MNPQQDVRVESSKQRFKFGIEFEWEKTKEKRKRVSWRTFLITFALLLGQIQPASTAVAAPSSAVSAVSGGNSP